MSEKNSWVLFQKPNETQKYLLRAGVGESKFGMTSFDGQQHVVISGSVQLLDGSAATLEWSNDISFPPNTLEEDHFNGVLTGVKHIEEGRIEKIVLSKVVRVEHHEIDPIELFNSLCSSYPKAFNYVCFHPESGLWSGATPELLLQKKNSSYTTVALAGTRVDDGLSAWTEKEYQEQRIVKDYIVEALTKAGIDSVEVEELTEAKNGHLVHLKNVLNFTHHGPVDPLLSALHPTPAVCGTPKNTAVEIINSLELHDRKFYTGYLSLKTTANEASFFVNLRCMEVKKEMSLLYAGGGITSSSDPKKEWKELLTKTKILKDVILGLQNQAHV